MDWFTKLKLHLNSCNKYSLVIANPVMCGRFILLVLLTVFKSIYIRKFFSIVSLSTRPCFGLIWSW